jgi:hypothetical protein
VDLSAPAESGAMRAAAGDGKKAQTPLDIE